MSSSPGTLRVDVHDVANPVLTVVCLHGLGLGPWFWEPWLPLFRAAGIRVLAASLPGHAGDDTNASLDDAVAATVATLDSLSGPVALVGHSVGGLVAQLAARGREVHALALVAPLPPGQVRWLPERGEVASGLGLLPSLLTGRPVKVSWEAYRRSGLATLPEAAAREVYGRIGAWPNRMVRDLVRPPRIEVDAVRCPVLVVLGKEDKVVPWVKARLLADFYEGVCWRYDGLGHMPPWEPGGERMGKAMVDFLLAPSRPEVIESEAFRPDEGVGEALRRGRRGEAMKKRSAYGQKKSAR